MIRCARLGLEQKDICSTLVVGDVFKEMIAYWNSCEFKKKSKKAKQRRSYENRSPSHRAGSISIAQHVQWMVIIFPSHYFFLNHILIYQFF